MTERNLLLNPGPGTTSLRIKEALIVPDICPREGEFGQVLKEIEQGLLEIAEAQSTHQVALFGASGTGAIEAMLSSALTKDDHLLLINNGAYALRMEQICERFDLQVTSVGSFGTYPELDHLRDIITKGDFSHLAMVHHETSTGMLNPLGEITQLAQEFGLTILLDAMSSFGAYPMPLNEFDIHYLAASSNKCIQGMAGLSFVIFKDSEKEKLSHQKTSYYFNVYEQWEYFQQKSQLRYTPPVQVCYAFLEAIKETLEEEVGNRHLRYNNNWERLYDGLIDLGFKPILPYEQQSKILLALQSGTPLLKGFDHFHDVLFQQGITVYPGVIPEVKSYRMAVIGDLYPSDIDRVLGAIRSYLRNHT